MEKFCFFVITYVAIYSTGNSQAELTCPEDYHPYNGNCCKSIICPKDTQFRLCQSNWGEDTCTPCSEGLKNPDVIDTREAPYQLDGLCQLPDCDCAPEAKLDNKTECKEGTKKVCVCDIQRGYVGEDPLNCWRPDADKQRLAERAGYEMTLDGSVRKCLNGFFKSRNDSSICRPHNRCSYGYTVDTPGTTIHDTKCKKNPSISTPDNTPSIPVPPTSSSPDSDQTDKTIISISVPVVIAAITVVFVFALCLKKKLYKKFWYYVKKRVCRDIPDACNQGIPEVRIEQDTPYLLKDQQVLVQSEEKYRNTGPSELEPLQTPYNGVSESEGANNKLPKSVGNSLDIDSLLQSNKSTMSGVASNFPANGMCSIPQDIIGESLNFPSMRSKDEGIGHSEEIKSEFNKPCQIVKPYQTMQLLERNHEEDQELTHSKEFV